MLFAICHPPYANSTGTSAVPIARSDTPPPPATGAPTTPWVPHSQTPVATRTANATSLRIVNAFWTHDPNRTPAALTPESRTIAATAMGLIDPWPAPVTSAA